MTIRIIHGTRDTVTDAARADGPSLWLERTDVERATGWAWKPEGLCRDGACMPVPCGAPTLVDGERLDVAGLWRRAGWPVARDDAGRLWVLGEDAAHRAGALASREAPDFELPDLDGHRHRLSDHRGRRVFLVAWASW